MRFDAFYGAEMRFVEFYSVQLLGELLSLFTFGAVYVVLPYLMYCWPVLVPAKVVEHTSRTTLLAAYNKSVIACSSTTLLQFSFPAHAIYKWTKRLCFQDWLEILVLHHKLGQVISESLLVFVTIRMLNQEWH